ncbi:hypothetical protein HaLaN_25403, partial [Haematococcus lacustris]
MLRGKGMLASQQEHAVVEGQQQPGRTTVYTQSKHSRDRPSEEGMLCLLTGKDVFMLVPNDAYAGARPECM